MYVDSIYITSASEVALTPFLGREPMAAFSSDAKSKDKKSAVQGIRKERVRWHI